jgi:hypothetical protein
VGDGVAELFGLLGVGELEDASAAAGGRGLGDDVDVVIDVVPAGAQAGRVGVALEVVGEDHRGVRGDADVAGMAGGDAHVAERELAGERHAGVGAWAGVDARSTSGVGSRSGVARAAAGVGGRSGIVPAGGEHQRGRDQKTAEETEQRAHPEMIAPPRGARAKGRVP